MTPTPTRNCSSRTSPSTGCAGSTDPAGDGRATEAARRALADARGVRPAAVSLRTGAASRDKLFLVERPAAGLPDVLRRLRDGSAE